jgi:type IV pilus assembly protein PilA
MMLKGLQRLRSSRGARDNEAGFTLIELLVVMLILGVLAAIALPAFFNQKEKANDSKAKEYAHSAEVAMETYATEHGGSYVGASETELRRIEPTLASATFSSAPVVSATGYTISIQGAKATQTFSITRTGGALTYTCTTKGVGGCPEVGGTGVWG